MVKATFHFPPGFKWGVATASHQVEGNNYNNQWWHWEQQPGHIANGDKSLRACDWWENAEADFDLAASLGMNALRLSIEWSRIEIAPGQIDTSALARYRDMLAALHERGIDPMVTLHHFSNPMWLMDMGGWANPDVIKYFARYVEQVVTALQDQVTLWCTINEPNVFIYQGYVDGVFPPGKQDIKLAFTVLRNMLKAHAQAYKVIHRIDADAKVGLAHNMRYFDPLRPKHPLDRFAAWAQDLSFNQTTLKPLAKGRWSLPMGIGLAPGLRKSLDFIGLNYYTRDRVRFNAKSPSTAYGDNTHADDAELLDGGYGEMYDHGLGRALRQLNRLNVPIYITENGTPDSDDDQRPRALLLHLRQVWRAIQQNTPVKGYYHWTLTDNFEWAEGWQLPFGLVYMNPETGERIPRRSAELYAAIAHSGAITDEIIDAYAPEIKSRLMPDATSVFGQTARTL